MVSIPRDLINNTPIKNYIDHLISIENIKDFSSLDDVYKERLVSLGLSALGNDVELILSFDANRSLANYLISYDRDHEIELTKAIQASAIEYFSEWFDEMIYQRLHEKCIESLYDNGLRPHQDAINGEIRWL